MKYVLNILFFACAIMVMHNFSSTNQVIAAHASDAHVMVASVE